MCKWLTCCLFTCNMPTTNSSLNPGQIITLILLLWYYIFGINRRITFQKLTRNCRIGTLHTTFKHIHLERLNICFNKCVHSSPHGVDQFTDISVSVFDMNSYESSMQSLYLTAWNCLPRFSANKVTGKRRCLGQCFTRTL